MDLLEVQAFKDRLVAGLNLLETYLDQLLQDCFFSTPGQFENFLKRRAIRLPAHKGGDLLASLHFLF